MTIVEFSIKGTSFVPPANLPSGFTLERKEVEGFGVAGTNGRELYIRADNENESLFVGFPKTGATTFISVENAKALRDYLNTAYPPVAKSPLRVIRDGDMHFTNRWYEMAPDQFLYTSSLEAAQSKYDPQHTYTSFETIKDTWGVYQMGYQS